ncbi:MAG: hypothetical protein M5R37_05870 [Melioribacteraceae bacterium]|nr:hypothetical protein [Melioribacteraceae bacterium]
MKQNESISPKYVLTILAGIVYIIFCFVIDVDKGVTFYKSTAKNYSYSDGKSDFEIPGNESQTKTSIDYQHVELDTLAYKIHHELKNSYLIARVICDNENIILVKLAIDPQNTKEYESYLMKEVRLKAEVHQIRKFPLEKEIYDFEGNLVWHQLQYDYMLEGNLEEIISVTPLIG